MTDDAEFDELPADVPGFDDPAHDDLRRLLAEFRVSEPMPADVAERLDGALVGVAAERHVDRSVVPLRPRRRTGSRLLVAAAVVGAVAVGGIGLSQIAQGPLGESESADSKVADLGSAPEAGGSGTSTDSGTGSDDLAALPALTSTAFKQDATRFLDQVVPSSAYSLDRGASPTSPLPENGAASEVPGQVRDLAALRASGCTPTAAAGRSSYAILLDGLPAVLVVLTAPDGSRSVQALSCAGEVLARTTLG